MTVEPTSQIAIAIFPRLRGVVCLLAFVSLLVQVRGLYSSGGILLLRLPEGSPSVVALFRTVPFRDVPPAYIRLNHYADRATRRASGGWWRRSEIGENAPIQLPVRSIFIDGQVAI